MKYCIVIIAQHSCWVPWSLTASLPNGRKRWSIDAVSHAEGFRMKNLVEPKNVAVALLVLMVAGLLWLVNIQHEDVTRAKGEAFRAKMYGEGVTWKPTPPKPQ